MNGTWPGSSISQSNNRSHWVRLYKIHQTKSAVALTCANFHWEPAFFGEGVRILFDAPQLNTGFSACCWPWTIEFSYGRFPAHRGEVTIANLILFPQTSTSCLQSRFILFLPSQRIYRRTNLKWHQRRSDNCMCSDVLWLNLVFRFSIYCPYKTGLDWDPEEDLASKIIRLTPIRLAQLSG